MLGLALILVACGGLALLGSQASAQWPIAPVRLLVFAGLCALMVNLLAAGLLITAAGCGKTHAASAPERRRAALLLRLTLANLLVPVFLYALMASDPAIEAQLEARGWDTPLGAAIAVLTLVAWRLWRRSRKYGALGADAAMARDPRPPILYLRSFADDGEALIGEQSWWMRRGAALGAVVTAEQEMAELLAAIGPVVAIGKPGEPLPELGAARLYVSDDQWQAKVQELMKKARLVVVRVGASPGLLWEIEQAFAHLPRQRLVLAVLGGSPPAPAIMQRLGPVLGPTLGEALPQPVPRGWTRWLVRDPRRRIGSLVCFVDDGTARVVEVKSWPIQWRDLPTISVRSAAGPLRRAWAQVFAHLGLQPREHGRSRAIAVGLAIFFGWLGAHWFYLGHPRRGIVYALMLPLLMVPLFLGVWDAFRFLWVDRSGFDTRFSALPSGATGA